jgi:hypothetical protein
MHATSGAGHQAVPIACASDGSGSIGCRISRYGHDVIASAHAEVGMFSESMESHGAKVQLDPILGIVSENDFAEWAYLVLASLADRYGSDTVIACADRVAYGYCSVCQHEAAIDLYPTTCGQHAQGRSCSFEGQALPPGRARNTN